MGIRNGRRARRKRRRRYCHQNIVQAVSLCHESQYVELRKWLKEGGFNSKSLIPALFSDTGRGLMTTKSIQAGDLLISLPENCLLTTASVLSSYMGEYVKRWKPSVSPLLALCAFLISERHLAMGSQWKPYVDVLPKTYTCPVYFPDDVISLLPRGLRRKALDQRDEVAKLHSSSLGFFRSLQPLFRQPVESIFTHDALRWAWCSVNTRTVYMEHPQSPHLSRERDVYALAPYLDLLNHCPEVQVEAGFSQVTRCYEIRSVQGCKKYQQAFICYGPHDNQRLLLEYGFVAPDNPHSVVYVDPGDLQVCLSGADKQFAQKLLFLKQHDFLVNLTFGPEGPSWRLMTVLRLLSLQPDQYSCWKSVLLGAAVSQDKEERSLHLAQTLCQYLWDENATALQSVSLLKEGAGASTREQLAVVECLRLEAQGILGHSQELLRNPQR
ncbi:SET domain-containing protein 4 [Megalops cyprinoides]|uniref:SET domain-containing protein 4 n=1 Tax=Megalops cyprinoides TaxID=118141 RepID=UPI001863C1A2|nr:SET domain-containing protein 4 [Megalops cyprinoides]